MEQLKIQTVVGAIRATKGITKSSKYPSSSRNVRSAGVYAELNCHDDIVLDFWSGHHAGLYNPDQDLAKVIETLEARGLTVVPNNSGRWSSGYIVKAAANA